jgi:hypothetical protein
LSFLQSGGSPVLLPFFRRNFSSWNLSCLSFKVHVMLWLLFDCRHFSFLSDLEGDLSLSLSSSLLDLIWIVN